jgi:hypothetical protein
VRSLGLLGMSERARTLGGTLRITSRPDHGTRVLLTLPLNASASGRDPGSGIRDPKVPDNLRRADPGSLIPNPGQVRQV